MADKKTEGAEIIPLHPDGGTAGGAKGAKCPMCAKPTVAAYRPFCSKRCADLDLGQWLGEGYRVPSEESGPLPDADEGEDI